MELSDFINKYFFRQNKDDYEYTLDNINENVNNNSLKKDDIFYATVNTTIKENNKKKRINKRKDLYMVKDIISNTIVLTDYSGSEFKTSKGGISIKRMDFYNKKELTDLINTHLNTKEKEEQVKYLQDHKALGFTFNDLEPEEKLRRVIEAGVKNIWMVGPAGCGKSTIARNIAKDMELPYLCISCGIGTSATEFIGYKYPNRESTRFRDFYSKPSVILIDELTALDPAVAQILNAALANDEIETTTGLVHRHSECIIIATSNTFGFGCDRQYVANNQLDASTIDRFIGGIVEVTYSSKYESRYDSEVVEYVNTLRKFAKETQLRKVLSTRMIQAGHTLKYNHFMDWRNILITNWSDNEKNSLKEWYEKNKNSMKVVLKKPTKKLHALGWPAFDMAA